MKRFSMMLLLPLLAACGDETTPPASSCGGLWDPQDESGGLPPASLLVLGTAADFSTSSVDLLAKNEPSCLSPNRAIGAGDAALRRVGDRAVLLNRGAASNLQVLEGAAFPGRQISLGECNPHDLAALDDGRVLVTCYDHDTMLVVDLDSGAIDDGPSLAAFADDDGVPEMDQLVRAGAHIHVTLQLLSRPNWYAPTGKSLLVTLDAATLAIVDVDPTTTGTQVWELPCQNPFSDLALFEGNLYLACSGDFVTPELAMVARLDPLTGAGEVVADAGDLDGFPTGLRLDDAGNPYVMVAGPDAFVVDEMRLVRLTASGLKTLATSPGYTLAGIGIAADGTVYFGNRSADATAGLWRVSPGDVPEGPFATSLPPYELELF